MDRMISANTIANATVEAVKIVLRRFLHRLRHAILNNVFMLNISYNFSGRMFFMF